MAEHPLDATSKIPDEEIRRQLKRLLESEALQGATRSRKLLLICIRKVLEGKAHELTEAKLAHEILEGIHSQGRHESVLRAAHHRLKERLEAHYTTEGLKDSLYIGFAAKSYVPEIRMREGGEALPVSDAAPPPVKAVHRKTRRREKRSRQPRRIPVRAVAAVVVLAAAIAGLYWFDLEIPFFKSGSPYFANLEALTAAEALSIDPSVSADGQTMVYASDEGTKGNLAVFLRKLDDGKTVRLTSDDFDARQPSVSADGRFVVYRSERDGSLHVVDTTTSQSTKIADAGRAARFSPDGKRVAFWRRTGEAESGAAAMFVLEWRKGTSKRVRSDFAVAQGPVWSPDGEHLLFVGQRNGASVVDWWVTPLDESEPTATGALNYPPRISGMRHGVPRVWSKSGNIILFEATVEGLRTTWAVPIDRRYHISDEPRRVTSGKMNEANPGLAASGNLVLREFSIGLAVWGLPLDPTEGRAKGEPVLLSGDRRPLVYNPAATENRMAYVVEENNTLAVYRREGDKEVAVADKTRSWSPLFTRTGTLVWLALGGVGPSIESQDATGELRTVRCEQCGRVLGASSDGRRVLVSVKPPNATVSVLAIVELATGERKTVENTEGVTSADWSPDGKWIAFASRTEDIGGPLRVVSTKDGGAVQAITAPKFAAENPRWSPDGGLLYYLGDEDSYRCLYAVRVDRQTGTVSGERWAVQHFHKARQLLTNVPPATQSLVITGNRALYSSEQVRGRIWYGEPSSR